MKRIGVDVGGTNTDAVLVDGEKIVAGVKSPTTEDVISGVRNAIADLQTTVGGEPLNPGAVMIGTTHFVNAVVQRRRLNRAASIRVCLPACASLPPFIDWPADLADAVNAGTYLVGGGHEYDGRPIAPLDEQAVAAAARQIRADGVQHIAISAVFSPLTDEHERRAGEIVANEHPDARVTLSSAVGRIGLLERENATLLNAALGTLAHETTTAFEAAVRQAGMHCPIYVTQNDGTVAAAAAARDFPVFSFSSGPTNSMRGAVFLSGLDDTMVCDVGGTTTDVGCARNGFPREANNVVTIGGVRTLFRMPDLLSIGLGGGSIVAADGSEVGPVSVGFRLPREALVFGGETLTATDIAVAAGAIDIGDRARVAQLPAPLIRRALEVIHHRIEESVDRMKSDSSETTLVAVGGGAALVPSTMSGISRVVEVPHYGVANAVGAAIAKISGEVDRIFNGLSRDEVLERATALAKEDAIAAGASPHSLEIIEMEDLPLAYLPGNSVRARVRVVGDVDLSGNGPGKRIQQ